MNLSRFKEGLSGIVESFVFSSSKTKKEVPLSGVMKDIYDSLVHVHSVKYYIKNDGKSVIVRIVGHDKHNFIYAVGDINGDTVPTILKGSYKKSNLQNSYEDFLKNVSIANNAKILSAYSKAA